MLRRESIIYFQLVKKTEEAEKTLGNLPFKKTGLERVKQKYSCYFLYLRMVWIFFVFLDVLEN